MKEMGQSPRQNATLSLGITLSAAVAILCLTLSHHNYISEVLDVRSLKTMFAESNATDTNDWQQIMKDRLYSEDDTSEYEQARSEISKFCAALLPKSKSKEIRSPRAIPTRSISRITVDADRAECCSLISRAAAEEMLRSRRKNASSSITYMQECVSPPPGSK